MNTADFHLTLIKLGDKDNNSNSTTFHYNTGKFTFPSSTMPGDSLSDLVVQYRLLLEKFSTESESDSTYARISKGFSSEIPFEEL
ncbi:MAG: hypothetical protein ACOYN2_03230 [Patescibacteria group bacterium]